MFFEKVCMFFKKYICFLKKYVCFLKKYIFFEKAYIFFVRLLLVHRTSAHDNFLYARYLCSRAHSAYAAARPSAQATIGYLVYKTISCIQSIHLIYFSLRGRSQMTSSKKISIFTPFPLVIVRHHDSTPPPLNKK